ncbi:CIC11C00000002519 [Sungouiella intermedia]|uniref:CIC11C00000002519 n=1 Tax=Sungouiella intermedia TaxID=45354 RepID=A0A1L0BU24_9ASCO|nr:CIC11C00000002519 [[Candida] intermedia]
MSRSPSPTTLKPSLIRPAFPHMSTSPDLVGFRTNSGPQYDTIDNRLPGDKSSAKELLDFLNERSNDEYKTVVFRTTARNNAHYQNRVSFDTVGTQIAEDPTLDFSDDDYYSPPRRMLNDMDYRGRGRDRDLLPIRSPGTSPGASPTRMLSPIRGMDMSRLFQNAVLYPTTPIITRRGCTFTKMHRHFEDLYLGKLLHKGLCPVLPGRVILVYISGRQHTWVAMDWILRSFIEHGDTVIIVSAVKQPPGPKNKMNKFLMSPTHVNRDPAKLKLRERFRERSRPEYIKQVAANVMSYAMKVVNPGIIAKITVEVCEGTTKDVLKDMYKLYEPNVVSTASKVNVRNSAPLKSWNSSRLSDRLVKNFPLPVIVVPALNMGHFERILKDEVEGIAPGMLNSTSMTASTSNNSKKTVELPKPADLPLMKITDSQNQNVSDEESLSDGSLHSEGSGGSVSTTESYDSFVEIAELYDGYRDKLHNELRLLASNTRDDQYFANFLRSISDKSLEFCEDLRGVDPDFRGQGAKLARAITGSNSFGAVPYKTKSLLAPVEAPKPLPGNSGAISIADLKRSLKLNAMKSDEGVHNGPSILVDPPSGTTSPTSETPKHSALTFSEVEKPSRRTKSSVTPLKKFLSHDDTTNSKVKLEPSKSHPDIRTVALADSDKKKKKKKKFWKLF